MRTATLLLGLASLSLAFSVTACKTERDTSGSGRDTATSGGASSSTASADTTLRSAMADSTAWPSFGRNYTNQRYSPLAEITSANVSGLQPAWSYKTGVVNAFEASPVVIGGTMYVSTALNHVVALDAATGAKKWEYSPTLLNGTPVPVIMTVTVNFTLN